MSEARDIGSEGVMGKNGSRRRPGCSYTGGGKGNTITDDIDGKRHSTANFLGKSTQAQFPSAKFCAGRQRPEGAPTDARSPRMSCVSHYHKKTKGSACTDKLFALIEGTITTMVENLSADVAALEALQAKF